MKLINSTIYLLWETKYCRSWFKVIILEWCTTLRTLKIRHSATSGKKLKLIRVNVVVHSVLLLFYYNEYDLFCTRQHQVLVNAMKIAWFSYQTILTIIMLVCIWRWFGFLNWVLDCFCIFPGIITIVLHISVTKNRIWTNRIWKNALSRVFVLDMTQIFL